MKKYLALILGVFAIVMVSYGIALSEDQIERSDALPPNSPFKAKDFSHLSGMEGFSNKLLDNHFKLYQGYVKNTNILFDKLDALLNDNSEKTVEYAELERRLGWEYNGMLLHEYYFENLGGKDTLSAESALHKKIIEEFGTFERWKKDFIGVGSMRGIGWAVLYFEPKTGKLLNIWVNEHNTGNITGAIPLLVMDVFEHAYLTDYELDKAKYIESFFKNINWEIAEGRFQRSL